MEESGVPHIVSIGPLSQAGTYVNVKVDPDGSATVIVKNETGSDFDKHGKCMIRLWTFWCSILACKLPPPAALQHLCEFCWRIAGGRYLYEFSTNHVVNYVTPRMHILYSGLCVRNKLRLVSASERSKASERSEWYERPELLIGVGAFAAFCMLCLTVALIVVLMRLKRTTRTPHGDVTPTGTINKGFSI